MIPLFPLGTTLFPGGLLPLKVFEPRYLTMTRQAFQSGEPFGIVALKTGSETVKPESREELHAMGVMAHIEEFEEFNPALFLIRVRGGERFHIESAERQKNGLWLADVKTVSPDPEVDVPQELEASAKQLGALIRSLQEHAGVALILGNKSPTRSLPATVRRKACASASAMLRKHWSACATTPSRSVIVA